MKKKFKFFLMAAIVAAGLIGCSDEVVKPGTNPTPDPGGDVVEGELTHATFEFNLLNPGTKAMIGDGKEPASETVFKSIRLLVFNEKSDKSGLLEANTIVAAFGETGEPEQKTTATVLVTSGTKRLLVIANSTGKGFDNQLENLTIGTTTYGDFLAGANMYDYGVSQVAPPTIPASLVTNVIFNELVVTEDGVTPPSASMVYSNALTDAASLKILQKDVTKDQSQTGAAGESDNYFIINVQRAVAKVTAYVKTNTANATSSTIKTDDDKGTLSTMTFNIRNMNRALNLFQTMVTVDKPSTPYYNAITSGIDLNSTYLPFYYRDPDVTTILPFGTDWSGLVNKKAYYAMENAFNNGSDGGNTYMAIKGKYTPDHNIISTIGSYDKSMQQFTNSELDAYNSSSIDHDPHDTGTFYMIMASHGTGDTVKYNTSNKTISEIPSETLFADSLSAKKVLWVINNPGQDLPSDTDVQKWTTPEASLLVYNGGMCYYRVNVRKGGSGYDPDYGDQWVTRNTHYRAAFTGFTKIGRPNLIDLDDCPECGPSTPTYVTAIIDIIDWYIGDSETIVQPY